MKVLTSQILVAVSVLAAVALGLPAVQKLLLLARANIPEETVLISAPSYSYIWPLILSLSPLALFAAVVALHRRLLSSRIGQTAFIIQSIYAIILISQFVYVWRLIPSISRNA